MPRSTAMTNINNNNNDRRFFSQFPNSNAEIQFFYTFHSFCYKYCGAFYRIFCLSLIFRAQCFIGFSPERGTQTTTTTTEIYCRNFLHTKNLSLHVRTRYGRGGIGGETSLNAIAASAGSRGSRSIS